MKRGIECWTGYDPAGEWCCHIKKQRGKLTLDEIRETLMEAVDEDFYMLVIKAMDEDIAQYFDTDDLDGDFVTLYRADDFFKWREQNND